MARVLTHPSTGHFYFTQLLLPVLIATAKKSPAGTVRVVNMSSIAHYMPASEGIRWSTLGPGDNAPAERRRLGGARLFGQSKLVKSHNIYVQTVAFLTKIRDKGNIVFSNELARRHRGDGIVSISLFTGAVNADLAGHAGSVMTRFWKLLGAGVCFILTGGDVEALAGDLPRHALPDQKAISDEVKSSAKKGARRQATVMSETSEHLDSDDPPESSKVYYRAITPLYAGTDPGAGELNGKVGCIRIFELPLTCRLTGHVKFSFSISLLGHASHFQVRGGSILDLLASYGSGVKNGSRNQPRPRKTLKLAKTLRLAKALRSRTTQGPRKTSRSTRSPSSRNTPRSRKSLSPRSTPRSKKSLIGSWPRSTPRSKKSLRTSHQARPRTPKRLQVE